MELPSWKGNVTRAGSNFIEQNLINDNRSPGIFSDPDKQEILGVLKTPVLIYKQDKTMTLSPARPQIGKSIPGRPKVSKTRERRIAGDGVMMERIQPMYEVQVENRLGRGTAFTQEEALHLSKSWIHKSSVGYNQLKEKLWEVIRNFSTTITRWKGLWIKFSLNGR